MGIRFPDLGRVWVVVLDNKYTSCCVFFLHRCSPHCDSKNNRRCKFYKRLFLTFAQIVSITSKVSKNFVPSFHNCFSSL